MIVDNAASGLLPMDYNQNGKTPHVNSQLSTLNHNEAMKLFDRSFLCPSSIIDGNGRSVRRKLLLHSVLVRW
ncbi:MAG: hypothetical protein LBC20_10720 [Planctomycetaceae bacterium]|nr:hypothetical protein [Planctomycetaceae bacterium]